MLKCPVFSEGRKDISIALKVNFLKFTGPVFPVQPKWVDLANEHMVSFFLFPFFNFINPLLVSILPHPYNVCKLIKYARIAYRVLSGFIPDFEPLTSNSALYNIISKFLFSCIHHNLNFEQCRLKRK